MTMEQADPQTEPMKLDAMLKADQEMLPPSSENEREEAPPTADELFKGAVIACVVALIMALGVALAAPASASLAGLILFGGVVAVAGAGLYALTRPRAPEVTGIIIEERVDTDLGTLLDAMSEPVAAVGPSGEIRFANVAYKRFLERFDIATEPLEGPRMAFAGHPLFAPVIFRLASRGDVKKETLLVAPAPGEAPRRVIIEERAVSGEPDAPRLWLFRDEGPMPVEPPKPVPEEKFVWADVLGIARFMMTPDGRVTSTYGGLAELVGAPVAPASQVRDFLPDIDIARLIAPVDGRQWGEPQTMFLRTVNETAVPVTVTAYHRHGTQKTVQIVVVPQARPELVEAHEPDQSEPAALHTTSTALARASDGTAPQALFPRLFAEAPLGAALLGADRRLVASNPAFARLLGHDLSAGMVLRQLVGSDYADAVQRLIDLAQQGLAPAGGVEVIIHGDEPRSVRLYATRVGKAGSALLFVVDATEQRLLEEQVAQSEKMNAVGQLAGGIAHDFNNLLTAISGYCDLLLQSHPVGDPSFPDISQIRQTAARAANLVRQLLAFSRQQTMRPAVVWLNDMIADLKVFLGRVITERIALQVTLGRDLWPVFADPGQIERVIMNLAVNARDAMTGGGRLMLKTYNMPREQAAKITNVDLRPSDYVVIEVTDTGVGIPKENLTKIFEPF
ncbi:MAG TPA: histidine kinase dimerization/phospho-acceptor domain-containing protein, partial [Alphaproteobacteria bacterium]|nr:histidine kinase dimerization/phospho-acceptor domain-containing protein [Alphaproteobacteria bacterium]